MSLIIKLTTWRNRSHLKNQNHSFITQTKVSFRNQTHRQAHKVYISSYVETCRISLQNNSNRLTQTQASLRVKSTSCTNKSKLVSQTNKYTETKPKIHRHRETIPTTHKPIETKSRTHRHTETKPTSHRHTETKSTSHRHTETMPTSHRSIETYQQPTGI